MATMTIVIANEITLKWLCIYPFYCDWLKQSIIKSRRPKAAPSHRLKCSFTFSYCTSEHSLEHNKEFTSTANISSPPPQKKNISSLKIFKFPSVHINYEYLNNHSHPITNNLAYVIRTTFSVTNNWCGSESRWPSSLSRLGSPILTRGLLVSTGIFLAPTPDCLSWQLNLGSDRENGI